MDGKMEYIDAKLERRKNKNRGYRKLRAWRKAVELYVLICEKVKEIPGHPYRLIDQIIESASSISSNIAEGYCRRSLKEYLYFLNVALGSSGEVYSRCYACYRAGQFSEKTFDEIDVKHYETEGDLLRLVESLQKKQLEGEWQDSFLLREAEVEYFVAESEEEGLGMESFATGGVNHGFIREFTYGD